MVARATQLYQGLTHPDGTLRIEAAIFGPTEEHLTRIAGKIG
jgi:hypothetical protein